MKKTLLIGLLILVIIICAVFFITRNNNSSEDTNKNAISGKLLDYEEYTKIRLDNIKSVEVIKYTEAGDKTEVIEDKTEISRTYNKLKDKTIRRKSDMITTDNTTIYRFTLNDDTKISIEIEADCVVINGDRYVLK